MMAPYDVLLTASAAGEAPVGLQSTGDASFCAFWTAAHVPALTLPVFTGPQGLPVGAQVIGKRHDDRALFHRPVGVAAPHLLALVRVPARGPTRRWTRPARWRWCGRRGGAPWSRPGSRSARAGPGGPGCAQAV